MLILEMDWILFWTAISGIGGLAAVFTIVIAILDRQKKKKNTLMHTCNELCEAISISKIHTLLNKLNTICNKGITDASAIMEIQNNLQQTVQEVKVKWEEMQLLLKSPRHRTMLAKMDTIVEDYHYCMRDVETIIAVLGCKSEDEIEKHISEENSQEMRDIFSTTSRFNYDVPEYARQLISLRFKDLEIPNYAAKIYGIFNNQQKGDRLFSIRLQAFTGDCFAQIALGFYYYEKKQYIKAFKWYKKAAEQGLAEAQHNIGICYDNGKGVDKNVEEAFKWYKKAAEQGVAEAQYNVGICYDNGKGVDKNMEEAFKWYKKAAEQGVAEAQHNVGFCYDEGIGVDKDEGKAFKWYLKAAAQGLAGTLFNIGICYNEGKGVDKDEEVAFKWFKKAAEQGVAEAQCNVGICYNEGKGIDKDEEVAFKWFKKAAEQGYSKAQYNVGVCYDEGKGCEQNFDQAFLWYTKASKNKENIEIYSMAMHNIGLMYLTGTIGFGSPATAVQFFQIAAENGNSSAQHTLGLCYENGIGMEEVDIAKAKCWYKKAADQGHKNAIESLIRLEEL